MLKQLYKQSLEHTAKLEAEIQWLLENYIVKVTNHYLQEHDEVVVFVGKLHMSVEYLHIKSQTYNHDEYNWEQALELIEKLADS